MSDQTQVKKIVTKIEANPLLQKRGGENGILRVAAYCRVSTDSEDQLESYNAQVSHYTETIMKNPKWQFVKIYADEGITGTLARKREEFLKMIRDCEKGNGFSLKQYLQELFGLRAYLSQRLFKWRLGSESC